MIRHKFLHELQVAGLQSELENISTGEDWDEYPVQGGFDGENSVLDPWKQCVAFGTLKRALFTSRTSRWYAPRLPSLFTITLCWVISSTQLKFRKKPSRLLMVAQPDPSLIHSSLPSCLPSFVHLFINPSIYPALPPPSPLPSFLFSHHFFLLFFVHPFIRSFILSFFLFIYLFFFIVLLYLISSLSSFRPRSTFCGVAP